ncbi:MAG: polysaccharide pyruvyl transferase family protein [Nocardioidaceae bacterium]
MVIEIRGTETKNKGAQLMLETIVERLGGEFELSATPIESAYDVRARLGLRQTLHLYRFPRAGSAVGNAVPGRLRQRYGLVADRDITGVLDASGFAYSDSFKAERSRREAIYGRAWARRGVPKVMLPQAFGPFEHEENRRWATELLEQAVLIFARDTTSAEHLSRLSLSTPVLIFPDFTIGVSAANIEPPVAEPYLAVVPNTKVITSDVAGVRAYTQDLVDYSLTAAQRGLAVVVIVHDAGDRSIADAVSEATRAEVFHSEEPRVLKAVLGHAEAVVASRFHSIVGALSQGVPTLALGWSHKYRELLNDFGVPEWLISVGEDPVARLGALLGDDSAIGRLQDNRKRLIERVDDMWRLTIAELRTSNHRASANC